MTRNEIRIGCLSICLSLLSDCGDDAEGIIVSPDDVELLEFIAVHQLKGDSLLTKNYCMSVMLLPTTFNIAA